MKNLLVPIGSSGNATNTLQYAIDFAEVVGAKIYVTQVYESTKVAGALKNIDAFLEEENKKHLQEVLDAVESKNVVVALASVKGDILESIEDMAKQLEIDMIVSSARSVSLDETLYLGKIPGKLVKDIELPVLIVPAHYKFKPVSKILMAIRSGKIKPGSVLETLQKIINVFNAKIDLIQVITPKSKEDDKEVSAELKNLVSSFKTTENATIFQGVLEHLHQTEPDMLCVMRRKRGFFSKLWEKDTVKKAYFESKVPLLVLKGIV